MQGNRRHLFIFIALFLLPYLSNAQNITVSGVVEDAGSKEKLFGANVYSLSERNGTITNAEGFFELTVPADTLTTLRFSYIGYTTTFLEAKFSSDTSFTLLLQPDHHQLSEVVIAGTTNHQQFHSGLMNVSYLTPEDIKNSPSVLGEPDLIKTLQLKPGIQSGNEGSNGYFVRGGQADQNLVLFDGVPVYNPSHLFGMFSIFPNDAIDKVRLYKGAFPARFGGRLSSVLDVGIRPGDMSKLKVSGGTGLISSRLTVEGPLVKEKLSLLVSGRRTYFDFITKKINEANAGVENYQPIPDYFFYDLSAKLHAQLGEQDELSFSGYMGLDRFNFATKNLGFDFEWGNKVGILQWKHQYNKKLSHETGISYSNYRYSFRNNYGEVSSFVGSGINDVNAFINYAWNISPRHSLSFGLQVTNHLFDVLSEEENDQEKASKKGDWSTDDLFTLEGALFLADSWQVNDKLIIDAGLRVSGLLGNDKNNSTNDTTENSGNYMGLEPRLSTRYQASSKLALKVSYSRGNQYVHLVSSSGSSLPANYWYPSNSQIKPQVAQQTAIGADLLLAGGRLLLSNEVYYRDMNNQIDFRDGAELFGNSDVINDLVFGKGWAYGNEVFLEKKGGKTTGWVGYTLSWTYRKFRDINGGEAFPSANDRRHDFTFVIHQEVNKRLSFNGNWVFCSGNVSTLPQSRVLLQGQRGGNTYVVPIYAKRNSFRMEAYHRLDLGLVYKFQPRWGEADLTLGAYNVYNRRNPYFVYLEHQSQEGDDAINFKARQVSLFPILPSISFNYTF